MRHGCSGLLGVWIWRRKKTTAEKAEEELLKRTASPRPEPPPQPKPPHTPSSSPTSASATMRTAGDQSPRTSASASASGLGSFVSAATIASTLVGSPMSDEREHEPVVDGHREARSSGQRHETIADEQTSPAANEAPVLIKFNDRRKVHKIRRGAVVDVQTPDDAGVGDFRVSRDDVHVALIEQDPSRVRLRLDGGEGMVRLSLIDRSDRPVCAWKFKLVA